MFCWRKKDKLQSESAKLIKSLDGREVKYVSKRDPVDYGEIILGKNGHINITDDELIILCEGEIVFRNDIKGLKAAELMSLDGINLRYENEETGETETVVAYYKYFRK